jgi:hypothetical protein
MARWIGLPAAIATILTVVPTRVFAQQVAETEPNNSRAAASLAHLGDTVSGTMPYLDVDYFAIDLAAGTKLVVTLLNHQFCPEFNLWDSNGKPLDYRSCMSDTHPHDTIYIAIPTTGRYYISIDHLDETPGDADHPPGTYQLTTGRYTAPRPGPANPMRVIASGLDGINGWIGTPSGDIIASQYITDHASLVRVSPQGAVTTFAERVDAPLEARQMAVDAFGDLLVPGGGVWRYSLRTGERSEFTSRGASEFGYSGIAVGSDGDVWLSELAVSGGRATGTVLSRFDALGSFKERITINGLNTLALAMSQGGELFFIDAHSDVYHLVNNATPQRVIVADPGGPFGSVTLDQDGWVYVEQPSQGKVLAFDAQYHRAVDPLVQVLDSLGWKKQRVAGAGLLWLRDGSGKMTSRVWVGRYNGEENTFPMDILELNASGMGAPGVDPFLHVKQSDLRAAAAGSAYADTLRLTEGTQATWSVVSGALPAGLSLSSSGVLSGTPSQTGNASFDVRAIDGARAGFAHLKMTVGAAVALEIDATPLRPGSVGSAYADTLQVTNADGAVTWTVTAGKVPPGVALAQATGVLSGTPSDTGSFAFTATATSGPRTGSRQFTIAIATQGTVTVAVADIVTALLGGPSLSAQQVQYLDGHGNHNGVLDVGDLRAYLRAQGQLSSSTHP